MRRWRQAWTGKRCATGFTIYNETGVAGLSDRHGGDTRPLLSPEQKAELAGRVRQRPDLTKHGVMRWRRTDLVRMIKTGSTSCWPSLTLNTVSSGAGFNPLTQEGAGWTVCLYLPTFVPAASK